MPSGCIIKLFLKKEYAETGTYLKNKICNTAKAIPAKQ
jgi:hypothetical protein